MANKVFLAHACMGITNNYGAWLQIGPTYDYARLAFDGGNGIKVCRWQKIKETKFGGMYLTHYGHRYMLDNFIGLDREKTINY